MDGKRIVFMLVIGLFLAACGAPPPTPKVNDAAGTEIVATFMAQITQTAAAAASTPTETESAPVTEETEEPDIFDELETPEGVDDPEGTVTPDPSIALLNRFRSVTVSNGNLYVRDGMGLPKQITQSGTDHDPVISDDGQKIVFYRGEKFDNVFVINADGSDEKAVMNNKLLPAIGNGYIEISTFRPGTHQLLFTVYFCKDLTCNIVFFLVDAETAKTTQLVLGLRGFAGQKLTLAVSPNWQYLVIADGGQLNLYSIDGKLIHANVLDQSFEFPPYPYWLTDSSGLVVFVPTDTVGTYIIRYSLKNNQTEQLVLSSPQPKIDSKTSCDYSISPDRTWFLYKDFKKQGYLGNLKDLKSKPYAWDGSCSIVWSADSNHFASQTEVNLVDGTAPIKLEDGHFIAWLDATHYLFSKGKSIIELKTYIAEVGKEASAVQVDFLWSPVYAVLDQP